MKRTVNVLVTHSELQLDLVLDTRQTVAARRVVHLSHGHDHRASGEMLMQITESERTCAHKTRRIEIEIINFERRFAPNGGKVHDN